MKTSHSRIESTSAYQVGDDNSVRKLRGLPRGLSLGAAEGAEVFLEEEAFFLPELFETPEPEVTFLLEVVEERLGLEEMISSRDLSRLEDILGTCVKIKGLKRPKNGFSEYCKYRKKNKVVGKKKETEKGEKILKNHTTEKVTYMI